MKLKHFLVSYPIPGGYMHAYVMAEDEATVQRATERLIDKAERQGIYSPMPIILQTRLTDGWKLVREIICKHNSLPAEMWKTVKDFHLTAWAMPADDPDCDRLMRLH